MDVQYVGCGIMDRIQMARDRDSWRKIVTAIMNFRFPYISGNFLTTGHILASLEDYALWNNTEWTKSDATQISIKRLLVSWLLSIPPAGHFE
jgi:hypothetical protein